MAGSAAEGETVPAGEAEVTEAGVGAMAGVVSALALDSAKAQTPIRARAPTAKPLRLIIGDMQTTPEIRIWLVRGGDDRLP